jgi:RecB family exonuclease
LQAQAACAFRAFAEKRLFSSAPETVSLGLDPRERGILVHKVLEAFWAEVQSQAALKALPLADRDALLTRKIDETLRRTLDQAETPWERAYLDTERTRLRRILRPWLDLELERPPFTVKSQETQLPDAAIGPLRLSVRVDRVDLAHDSNSSQPGGEIILDYKTGPAKPSDWLGERPDAPQLPLYAVLSESQNLAAVAFAQIRAGKDMGLQGYEAHEGILPRGAKLPAATLAAQVREWRAVLTSLATSFHAGDAQVAPKRYPNTCQFCAQRLLCRLDLSSLEPDLESEEDFDPDTFESEAFLG